jgi:hypothetical protein
MVKVSALLYVFLAVFCLILTAIDVYKAKRTWGELVVMTGVSLVPVLNVVVAFILIEDVIMRTHVMKKKVF